MYLILALIPASCCITFLASQLDRGNITEAVSDNMITGLSTNTNHFSTSEKPNRLLLLAEPPFQFILRRSVRNIDLTSRNAGSVRTQATKSAFTSSQSSYSSLLCMSVTLSGFPLMQFIAKITGQMQEVLEHLVFRSLAGPPGLPQQWQTLSRRGNKSLIVFVCYNMCISLGSVQRSGT